MFPAEALQRKAELRATIARHNELYYRQARPTISDFEYDVLKRELEDLERQFPDVGGTTLTGGELPHDSSQTAASANVFIGHNPAYHQNVFLSATAPVVESPTVQIGDDRMEGFARVRHRLAMTTLDNTYDEAELREFHSRLAKALGTDDLAYTVEPKIDGVAVSLTFERGRLVRAVTRGDGEEGDDVTANVRTIRGLPQTLRGSPVPEVIEIRGEIFLRDEEFRRINQQQQEAGEPAYANPRNLTAGTLKQLDSKLVASRKLEIVLYGIGYSEPVVVDSQTAYHAQLKAWGLPVREEFWSVRGFDAVWAAIQEIERRRRGFPFATDGAVVKLDSIPQRAEVGYRGEGQSGRKLSPRWASAFKFPPERAETTLLDITIQVGRTGVLTPVAELAPILLAGTTVARATLHNKDEITRKQIHIGDVVVIEKAGEIIPAVISARRTPQSAPFVFPAACPVCGTKVEQRSGEVAVRCPNPSCPAQLVGRLDYLASRGVLDVEGLGGVVAERLVAEKWVHDVFDLFKLDATRLSELNLGTSDKKRVLGASNATRIVHAIERSRRHDLSRWILAMQIRDVGGSTSQDLATVHGDLLTLADSPVLPVIVRLADLEKKKQEVSPASRTNRPKDATERTARKHEMDMLKHEISVLKEKRRQYPGAEKIGPEVARHVIDFFRSDRGKEYLQKLTELNIRPVSRRIQPIGVFAGKTFVLTGTLPSLTREQAKQAIESAGGKVSGSVSKNTSYVLAGAEAGAKLEDAVRLGVAVLDEQRFIRMLESTDGLSNQNPTQTGLSI